MRKFWIIGRDVGLLVMLLVLQAAGEEMLEQPSKKGDAPADAFLKNWTSFRGPNALGCATHTNPPLRWNAADGANVVWKVVLPKHGMSSPIVWEDRIFLTGADDDSRQLYCVDAESGKLLWQHEVTGVPGSPDDGKIPDVLDETGFAAPTPITNGKYVAAVFATGELVCVNLQGKRIWTKHLGIPHNHYGHASSLLCHENLLFVQYDQMKNSQLLAFELASGKPIWRAKRGAMSWSSPILAKNNGRMELILTDNKAVESYAPESGKRLWRQECLGGEIASSAAYANGTVYVANEGAPASAIDISGQKPESLWEWDGDLPDAASLVANERYLIVPTAFGVVSCLDAKTGKALWEHEFDLGFSSSPILAADRVFITDLSGTTQIFKMSGKFELLGEADVGEPVYATPAFVSDKVYVRSLSHLFCIKAKEN